MDLLILNICETSVTTFLAHSWKDWSGLSEQGRTGQRISPGTLTALSVKLTGFAPLLLVFVAETRHCHAQRSLWSFARCCERKLKCFCSERTQLHPSCFHGLLAVPHGIFAPFLSNCFFFFSSSSCVLISDRLPARVAECGVSNHVSNRGVTKEFT